MARRMEIELTSLRDDGTFTWRAAGARQPKGVAEAKLLEAPAKVGDVLRVEAEFQMDGVTIVQVLPTKGHTPDPARIELIPERHVTGGVTTSLVSKEERRGAPRRGGMGDDRPRRDRPERAPRTGGPSLGAPSGGRPQSGRPTAGRPAVERGEARPRPPRAEGAEGRPPREGAAPRRPDSDRRPARTPTRVRPARLAPGRAHLDAFLDTLAPERRPIAEQLALGGLPKVRRGIADEQAAAQREGRPAASGDAIVAIAEELLSSVREAAWRDRADAAAASLEQISLRDLRAAVVGAAPQNDEGRELLRKLREALEARVNKLRATWEEEMTHALDEGRVLQALRLSARLPEPSARFPASLVTRLAEAAGTALSAEAPAERWVALLEAALASPIRRSIHPTGLPEDPTGAVRHAATAAAGRIPTLAKLLGLAMPPPPRPIPAPARPARPAASGPDGVPRAPRPVPPPPRPQAAVEVHEVHEAPGAAEPAAGDVTAATSVEAVAPVEPAETFPGVHVAPEADEATSPPVSAPESSAAAVEGAQDTVADEPVDEAGTEVEGAELA